MYFGKSTRSGVPLCIVEKEKLKINLENLRQIVFSLSKGSEFDILFLLEGRKRFRYLRQKMKIGL